MNKSLLCSSLAAAALLSGCRVYLPGESPRRTVFVNNNTTVRTETAPAARVSDAGDHSAPSSDRIAPGPVVAPQPVVAGPPPVQVTEPTPVVGVVTGVLLPAGTTPNATSTMTVAPILPPTAGADSYRNYMGKGSSAAAPANRPATPAAAPATPAAAPAGGVQPVSGGYRMYTVQKGDTAGTIANANGMTLAEFAKLNNLSDPNKLRVGQTVKIATGRPALSGRKTGGSAAAPTAAAASAQRAQSAVHPVQATAPTPTTRPVVSLPTPTTRPPARVTAAEASAAPGSTVKAGEATYDVDAALSGGGLGAARQRAQDAAQDAARQTQTAAQDAARQTQAAVRDAAQQAQDAVRDAAQQAQAAVPSAASSGTREYVVQENDDIYSIALQFNSQPLKIRALNGGKSLDDLAPGDRILVPAK